MKKIGLFTFSIGLLASICLFSNEKNTMEVHGEDENTVSLSCNNNLTEGNSYYASVDLRAYEQISALSLEVHFNADVLSLTSTYNSISNLMYDSSIHDDYISYSYIFNEINIESSQQLFYFYFSVKSPVISGNYYFDVVITEAYDLSLESVSVNASRKYFNVENRTETKSAYANINTSYINTSMNNEFSFTYSMYNYEPSSGTFILSYNDELFEFVSLTKGSFFDNMLFDYNANTIGEVYISFAASSQATSSNLFTFAFKTKANLNTSSTFNLRAAELYDTDMNLMTFSANSLNVNITYDASFETYPLMSSSCTIDDINHKAYLNIKLEENSHIGAGDFVLSFNKNILNYVGNTKNFSPTFFTVNDKEAQLEQGQIKFSILSTTDIVDAENIITIEFSYEKSSIGETIAFGLTGSGLTDALTNPITLSFAGCETLITCSHSFGEWQTVVAPTCTEKGSEQHICSLCDEVETREVPATGHHYSDEWTIDVEPTCEAEGEKSHQCIEGDDRTDVTIIPATGHKPGSPVEENRVESTCKDAGSYDLVTYCSVCHKELSREHVVLPLGDHTFGEWQIVVSPTCTEKGTEQRICSVCGAIESRDVPATGHHFSEEWTIDTPAACESDGEKSHHCENCDERTDVTVIPATGHTPGAPVEENRVEATCEHAGSYDLVTYCETCHKELSREHVEIPKLDHNFGEWNVVKEATFEEEGLEERTCSVCGEVEQRVIPKLDAKQYFIDAVNDIHISKDSTEELFNKIKTALYYYSFIEDKDSVPTTYKILQDYINTYNQRVEGFNQNHEKVSNNALAIVAVATSMSLLAALAYVLKKGGLK